MQERRELQPPVPARRFAYAFQTCRRTTIPAQSPGCGSLVSVSFSYAPSLHHLRREDPFVRRLLRYYGRIRLLRRCYPRIVALGLPWVARGFRSGRDGDLPASVQETSRRVQGLRPRRTGPGLAIGALFRVAFRIA